jgi:SAM-dependent methyltransferase
MAREHRTSRGKVPLMTTTLWDYHSQNYPGGQGKGRQGDSSYAGATPSYVIWNLLQRYTREKWLVVDPMCGSGTTLDVARDLDRRALGYDLQPTREDIFRADARKLPLESGKADFVFIDPPYSTHIKYSGQKECIGELDARSNRGYYAAMEKVIAEIHRVLKPDRCMALYVTDSAKKGQVLEPIGFELFTILRKFFVPVEIVAVARHNRTLKRANYHDAAADGNFFLRGFNYLFIMQKLKAAQPGRKKSGTARKGKDPGRSGTRKASTRNTPQRKTSARKTSSRKTTAGKSASRKTSSRKSSGRPTGAKRRK